MQQGRLRLLNCEYIRMRIDGGLQHLNNTCPLAKLPQKELTELGVVFVTRAADDEMSFHRTSQ